MDRGGLSWGSYYSEWVVDNIMEEGEEVRRSCTNMCGKDRVDRALVNGVASWGLELCG